MQNTLLKSHTNLAQVKSKVIPILKHDLSLHGLTFGAPIFIRIFKEEKQFELWVKKNNSFHLYKTYPICYFSGQLGPKQKEGDYQAVEGFYEISMSQLNPHSRFHLSFNIGFPNRYDRSHQRTGSYLMVHGDCVSVGCYAMTDTYIEEIYILAEAALQNGQKAFSLHAFPFRMSAENMEKHQNSEWFDFWQNLQEGYAMFEKNKQPPAITVKKQKYIFHD